MIAMLKGKKENLKTRNFKRSMDGIHKMVVDANPGSNHINNDDENNLRILKQRAEQLAKPPRSESDVELIEIIVFTMAYENYGIESEWIREIYTLKEIVPIPGTPAFVMGITNVRGQILSVIDMKKLFELPATGISEMNKIIIIRNKEMEFGLLADFILGMKKVNVNSLQRQLPTLTGVRAKYLLGISSDKIIILDGEKLLTDKDLVVNVRNEN